MTALSPDSALARGMASGRSQLNARIADARKDQLGFDTEALSSWLTGPAASLAECVSLSPELTSVFIDVSLMLVVHGFATGTARKQFEELWTKVLPECRRLLSENPRQVFGILHNAAINIRRDKSDTIFRWINHLSSLAGKASTISELRALCSVLAWRSGLAHYRTSALQEAESISPQLARMALGIPSGIELSDALAGFAADRWYDPSAATRESLKATHEVGSFIGYGGAFSRPPTVRADGDGFAVKSGDRYFWLCADAFGAVLHAGSETEYANAMGSYADHDSPEPIVRNGELHVGTNKLRLNLPHDGLSVSCTCDTAAVYSPWSHSIILVSLPGGVRR